MPKVDEFPTSILLFKTLWEGVITVQAGLSESHADNYTGIHFNARPMVTKLK
jgi:hypothetical protein